MADLVTQKKEEELKEAEVQRQFDEKYHKQ